MAEDFTIYTFGSSLQWGPAVWGVGTRGQRPMVMVQDNGEWGHMNLLRGTGAWYIRLERLNFLGRTFLADSSID